MNPLLKSLAFKGLLAENEELTIKRLGYVLSDRDLDLLTGRIVTSLSVIDRKGLEEFVRAQFPEKVITEVGNPFISGSSFSILLNCKIEGEQYSKQIELPVESEFLKVEWV